MLKLTSFLIYNVKTWVKDWTIELKQELTIKLQKELFKTS
jgi:hypothetical protein